MLFVYMNKRILITADDIITGDKFLSLASENITYIKTDVLVCNKPIMWRGNYNNFKKSQIWISGHSDYEITDAIYNKYKHLSKKWFATNINLDTCKVEGVKGSSLYSSIEAIPIGHVNYCNDSIIHQTLGSLDTIVEIMQMPKSIDILCYMNFSINTFPQERQKVYNLFIDKKWMTTDECVPNINSRKNCLIKTRHSRFVLCPRGNGIDTHRLWETLYLGSIPIVKNHPALDNFKELPILWIDDWNDVTEDFLHKEYDRIMNIEWNLEKLTFGYWAEKIKSFCKNDSI